MSDKQGAISGGVKRKKSGKVLVEFTLVSKARENGKVKGAKAGRSVKVGRWDKLWPEFLEELKRLAKRYGLKISKAKK